MDWTCWMCDVAQGRHADVVAQLVVRDRGHGGRVEDPVVATGARDEPAVGGDGCEHIAWDRGDLGHRQQPAEEAKPSRSAPQGGGIVEQVGRVGERVQRGDAERHRGSCGGSAGGGEYVTGGWARATAARSAPRPRGSAPSACACTPTLPSAVASVGPATSDRPDRAAVRRHSNTFWAPPPTRWIVRTSRPDRPAASSTALHERRGQRLDHEPHHVEGIGGDGPPGLRASRTDLGHHVVRSREPRVVDVEQERRFPPVAGGRDERGQVTGVAGGPPHVDATVEHPEAHHVAQEPGATLDALLVREVGDTAGLGDHRTLQLHADEGPRAARDVRRGGRIHRDGRDRRGRVVRPDRHHRDRGRRTEPSRHVGGRRSDHGSRVDDRGEAVGRQAEELGQVPVPRVVAGPHQTGRRRDGPLADGPSGEGPGDEIGDQRDAVTSEQATVGPVDSQLEEGRERQVCKPLRR